MIKARLHQVNPAVLWQKIMAIYWFFAPPRSYGYALSQDKQYLTHDLVAQIQRGQHD